MTQTRDSKSLVGYSSFLIVSLFIGLAVYQPLHSQNPTFTYQGELNDAGVPANGLYDLQFGVFDAASDGSELVETAIENDLLITDGIFTVTLDVGSTTFDGGERWLEIRVRPGASTGDFTSLAPRQRITAAPYAITASKITGPIEGALIVDGTVTTSKLAPGSVGTTQIAVGAVTSEQLAAGAVQAANIAPGSITSTQLAKPPRSGSVSSNDLDIDFGQATFTVLFDPFFTYSPIVTLGMQSASPEIQPFLSIEYSSSTYFTGLFRVPLASTFPDNGQTSAAWSSQIVLPSGHQAISFVGTNQLRYVRTGDIDHSVWSAVAIPDPAFSIAYYTSLVVVNGRPAISYHDSAAGDLKFVRANDSLGSNWGTAITVDSTNEVGKYNSMKVVNGYPAISYYDAVAGELKFIRATDADGTAWLPALTLDSDTDVGKFNSLMVINGFPAISYYDATLGDLKFIYAMDASGTTWNAPVIVDSVGDVGQYCSLALVNGNPAISYYQGFPDKNLRFVRASDSSGTTWGTPVTPDSNGDVGRDTSLAIINGKPAITYHRYGNDSLKYVRATDTNGSLWGAPAVLDRIGLWDLGTSLIELDGRPAVSYQGEDGHLHYLHAPETPPAFSIQWIALEP